MPNTEVENVDVVVVGAGSAAMAAAIACRQNGAERVVLLEKAPEPEFGGNPRFSHSGFRWVQTGKEELRPFLPDFTDEEYEKLQFEPYTEEQFHSHISRVTRGRMDPDLQNLLIGESNAALHWLLDSGLKFAPDTGQMEIEGKIHFEPGYTVHPKEGGIGQLLQLREISLGMGIEIRYESRVSGLLGNMHEITGVHVVSAEKEYDIVAKATFLCAGGFQASPEKRARYLGPNSSLMKIRGSRHNTGEVLEKALELGAQAAGHWQLGHSSVVDANAPNFGVLNTKFNRYSYLFGIMVNTRGQRFVDEGSNLRMMTYAKMGWVTLAEPDGIAFQIFDQKMIAEGRNKVFRRKAYAHAPVHYEADTIKELAGQLDINPEMLQHTVDEFNAAVPDSPEFIPNKPDGRATQGLAVPKSNWAQKLDEPPFVAYPVTAGLTFTFGGLKINPDAQVLNTSDQPIKRLYASGDIVGLFYHGYVGSTGQTRNVVFSRRGAKHATDNLL